VPRALLDEYRARVSMSPAFSAIIVTPEVLAHELGSIRDADIRPWQRHLRRRHFLHFGDGDLLGLTEVL
jgi:hypothetical protein